MNPAATIHAKADVATCEGNADGATCAFPFKSTGSGDDHFEWYVCLGVSALTALSPLVHIHISILTAGRPNPRPTLPPPSPPLPLKHL